MTQPVRFALAGFGAWGKFHAQSIAGNPDARLVAITAPSEESRIEARKLYPEALIFSDSQEMIAQAEFDIIDIVTPSHTHREIALAAMERGKHVLLEKPMAITLEDCKAIVAGAQQFRVHLAVGHELRLSSQWGRIKEIIDSGTIGDPQYVLVELSRKPYRLGASGWRYDQGRVGSWVLEEPIHFFDLARWYLESSGDPVELQAYANSRDSQRPTLFDNFSAMPMEVTRLYPRHSLPLSIIRRSRSAAPKAHYGLLGAVRWIAPWSRSIFSKFLTVKISKL